MDYIEQIFERTNLQQIRSFLLYGTEYNDISDKSYAERDQYAFDVLYKALEKTIADDKKFDMVLNAINAYSSEMEDMYMEIGMQCGFMLAAQLYRLPYAEQKYEPSL